MDLNIIGVLASLMMLCWVKTRIFCPQIPRQNAEAKHDQYLFSTMSVEQDPTFASKNRGHGGQAVVHFFCGTIVLCYLTALRSRVNVFNPYGVVKMCRKLAYTLIGPQGGPFNIE